MLHDWVPSVVALLPRHSWQMLTWVLTTRFHTLNSGSLQWQLNYHRHLRTCSRFHCYKPRHQSFSSLTIIMVTMTDYTIYAIECGPGTHFTNDFSITIQMWWKFHLALIQLLMITSQQNLAHATTAQLSCHVPNIVAITLLVFGWEQNEISITFELWWKNC